MKIIYHTILLSRPLNIFIAVSCVFIMSRLSDDINWLNAGLASFVLFCFMSGANILNDYIDIDADRINKPDRVLARGLVNSNVIVSIIIFIFSIGSYAATYLPELAKNIALFMALPSILLYEIIFKRIPLVGNIVISLLVGVVFVFSSYSLGIEGNESYKIMILAFFLNVMREIIKDIQDIEGDRRSGLRTLPIYFGVKKTIIVIRFIYLVFFIISLTPMYTQAYEWQYIPLLVFLIHVPLLYIIARLNDGITQNEYAKFSKILKIIIINGIIILLISAN